MRSEELLAGEHEFDGYTGVIGLDGIGVGDKRYGGLVVIEELHIHFL